MDQNEEMEREIGRAVMRLQECGLDINPANIDFEEDELGVTGHVDTESGKRLSFGGQNLSGGIAVFVRVARVIGEDDVSTPFSISREIGQRVWYLEFLGDDTLDGGIVRLGKECGLDSIHDTRAFHDNVMPPVFQAIADYFMRD